MKIISITTGTKKSHLCKQMLSTIPSCLISLCSGMTFGITAVMLPQLRNDKTIYYNPSHESWIASVSALTMVIGSFGSGHILDHYGRRIAHVILGIPFIIGWIMISCAKSTTIIILGRFFTGLSSGANRAVTAVYIGELASPKIRTYALIVPNIFINLGVVLSHVIGYYLNWKVCSYICIIPAVLIATASPFLKESPLWLIGKGRMEEGVEIFRWFRGTDDASEAELKTAMERQSQQPKMSAREILKVLRSSSFIKPMLTLLVVMINVQFSGVAVISFYAQDIFQQTFSGTIDPFIIIAVMDGVICTMPLCACFLGKHVSRKKCLLISNFGVSAFVGGLIACLIVGYGRFIWIPILCLVFFLGFSTGIFTMGWVFVPELLPSCARGLGSGLNSALSSIFMFTLVKVTPDFMKSCGPTAVYAFSGASTLICGVILYFALPETDGKTLQAIEDSYNKKPVESTLA